MEVTTSYEIVPAFLASIYVGFNNAQGMDIGSVEEIALYGPTIFAAIRTSAHMFFVRERLLANFHKKRISLFDIVQLERILSNKNISSMTERNTLRTGLASVAGYYFGSFIGSF